MEFGTLVAREGSATSFIGSYDTVLVLTGETSGINYSLNILMSIFKI